MTAKKSLRTLVLSIFALSFSMALPVSSTVHAKTEQEASIQVKFNKMIEGDIAEFSYKDMPKSVRYQFIDTPETTTKQPLSDKALKRSEALLKSAKKIELSSNPDRQLDSENREIRSIWIDDEPLQEILVKEGLARVTPDSQSDSDQLKSLQKIEKSAKNKKIGIWRVKGYVTEKGFNTKKYNADKTVKSLNKKAKNAIALAEKTPTKENYKLATTAIKALDTDTADLTQRLDAVNQKIQQIEQEKQVAEQAAKAEQDRKAAEQAEQQRVAAEQAAKAEQDRKDAEAAAQAEQQRIAAEQAAANAAAQEAAANTNNTNANKWAIEDGYSWQTRKGHSTVIPPGGTLPPGYHWQVR